MRYLLFVLLLILPVFAGAQTRVYVTQDQPQQIRQFRGGVDALNYFRLPVQGGHSIPAGDSLWFVRVNPGDGNIYMWDGLTWKCVSCGSGSGADSSLFVTLTRLIDSLNAMRSALADTSQAIRDDFPDVSGFVQYSDTANMLAPYVRSVVFLDSLQMHWNAIYALQSAAPYYANVLFGDGAPSGTPDNVNSAYFDRITWDTYKWNGTSWDLQMAGGLVDTTGIWKAINDTSAALRQAIDGKEDAIPPGTTADYWRGDKTWQAFPAIPDISGLIPYSDTGNLIATTYGVDTAKQNIRDEISNIPAPPVTSVNGQTGNVVLQFMDTAYVSGDTIYAEKGGNTFVVGVMTGGGSLDTAAVSYIIGDSLQEFVRIGGNIVSDTLKVGTLSNHRTALLDNNEKILTTGRAGAGLPGISIGTSTVLNIYHENAFNALWLQSSGGMVSAMAAGSWSVQTAAGSGQRLVYSSIGRLGVGYPFNVNLTAKINVNGDALFENGSLTARGNSTATGILSSFQASNNSVRFQVNNNGSILTPNIGTSPQFTGVYVRNGDSLKSVSISQFRDSLPYVPEGTYLTYTDPNDELIPADNSVIVVTLTTDASIILPDNPPVKSRAIVKVFGSANGLTVKPNTGGTIDQESVKVMTPKEGRFFLHIGSNNWIIINQ